MTFVIVYIGKLMIMLFAANELCTGAIVDQLPFNPIGKVEVFNERGGCAMQFKSVDIPEDMIGLKSGDVSHIKINAVVLYFDSGTE